MTIRVKNSALRTFQKVLPFSKKSWKKFLECAGRWKNVQESVEAEIVEKAEMNPGLSVTPYRYVRCTRTHVAVEDIALSKVGPTLPIIDSLS